MKQVLQNFKTGELTVEEVPPPVLQEGYVLVRNLCSLISPGTEGGTVKLGKASLLGKARARPEQVKKVIRSIQSEGLLTTYQFVRNSLDLPNPLGYCCAGEVIAVGAGVESPRPGERVACGGGGHAVHAEVVAVPKNLCVPVPEGLDPRWAAFTTLGSIAMQSLRVAEVELGDHVVVIGLGLVGLLTCRLLRTAGCHVFGIDLDEERARFAVDRGFCERARARRAPELMEQVAGWTSARGADAIIVTAATPNNDPVALAGELARPKARVVVVGRTRMDAPRETYLFKELELRTSLAYGPGAGDPSYEEGGQDYPLAYVRWTEGRNMEAFARLAAAGRLDLEPLISHELAVDDAPRAFELIADAGNSGALGVVLRYPDRGERATRPALELAPGVRRSGAVEAVRVGVVGAGSFATNVMIPTLAGLPGVELVSIASAKGIRARSLGGKYGFRRCTSSAEELIADPELDLVLILTRHDSHAPLAERALRAGKAVFVEKPLAMTEDELAAVAEARELSGRPLMVGFNRRYADLAIRLKELFERRAQPLSISYLANVGYRPPEHWLHHPKQGGGVVLGEACHFIDFCHWLTESELRDLGAAQVRDPDRALPSADNVHLMLSFADGSLATVRYLSNGNPALGRERAEVLGDHLSAALEDFRLLEWAAKGRGRRRRRAWLRPDKGYRRQLETLMRCLRRGQDLPHQELYLVSSRSTLRAVRALDAGPGASDPDG